MNEKHPGSQDSPIVRDSLDSDMESIRKIYSHYVLNAVATFEETPPSVDEMARRCGLSFRQGKSLARHGAGPQAAGRDQDHGTRCSPSRSALGRGNPRLGAGHEHQRRKSREQQCGRFHGQLIPEREGAKDDLAIDVVE